MRKIMNALNLENLKELRLKKGLTQTDICKAVGVSLPAYQMWERGISTPAPENYEKLIKLLEETEDK